jgi:aminopeptidase N
MLQGIVGEEAFLKALRAYQAAHRFAKAGTDDLRRALEEASGRELEAYFDAWIYGTELPRLRVSWRSEAVGGGQRTTVKVEPEHLPGPVPLEIAVVHAEGRTVRNVSLPPEGLSWTFDSPRKPSRVEVNANRALLAEIVGAR